MIVADNNLASPIFWSNKENEEEKQDAAQQCDDQVIFVYCVPAANENDFSLFRISTIESPRASVIHNLIHAVFNLESVVRALASSLATWK